MADDTGGQDRFHSTSKHIQDAKLLFPGQPAAGRLSPMAMQALDRLSPMQAPGRLSASPMQAASRLSASPMQAHMHAAGMHASMRPSCTPPPAHSGLAPGYNFLQVPRPSPHGSPFTPQQIDENSLLSLSQIFSLPPATLQSRLSPMPSNAPTIRVTPPHPPRAPRLPPEPHNQQQLLQHLMQQQLQQLDLIKHQQQLQQLGLLQGAPLMCSRPKPPPADILSHLLRDGSHGSGGLAVPGKVRRSPSPGRQEANTPTSPPIMRGDNERNREVNALPTHSKLYQHLTWPSPHSPVHHPTPVSTGSEPALSVPHATTSDTIPTSLSLIVPVDTHTFSRQISETMPRLVPAIPFLTEESAVDLQEDKENEEEPIPHSERKCPYNKRVVTLSNLPCHQAGYRAQYRAHSVAITRATVGSITSTAKSLDILRQNLQKHINKDIDEVIQRYLDKFFKIGLENIKENNGEGSVTEEHTMGVCRQILDEAKKMYVYEGRSVTPDTWDNVSESGSLVAESSTTRATKHNTFHIRKRRGSSDDSETSIPCRKKKGRPPIHHGTSGRSTPSKTGKYDSIKREGLKWDHHRIKSDTQFVMGAKANKVLGLGATRGRIYIKHPELFKYSGDQDDKQWLYERQYMPATGGKAYMLIADDIQDLAINDEYKKSSSVSLTSLSGFTLPEHILEKVRAQMKEMCTELKAPMRAPSSTPPPNYDTSEGSPVKLPFTNNDSAQPSPTMTDSTDLLADDEDAGFAVSPGFDVSHAGASPPTSDLDGDEDDEAPLSTPFKVH